MVWSYVQFSIQYFFAGDANSKLTILDVMTAPIPPRQQFWFLAVLYMMTLVVGAALCYRRFLPVLWGLVLVCLAARSFAHDQVYALLVANDYVTLLGEWVNHVPFFVLGILWGTDVLKKVKMNAVACVVLFAVASYAADAATFAKPAVTTLAALFCVFAVYKFSLTIDGFGERINQNFIARAVAFVGMNSMIIYLAHVICTAAVRSMLIRFGIMDVSTHLWLGSLAGVALPLLLVPVGVRLQSLYPRIAGAILPVRVSR